MQRVQVRFPNSDNAYTYDWNPHGAGSLKVGDEVVLPTTKRWQSHPNTATVVALGSEYGGECTLILRRFTFAVEVQQPLSLADILDRIEAMHPERRGHVHTSTTRRLIADARKLIGAS